MQKMAMCTMHSGLPILSDGARHSIPATSLAPMNEARPLEMVLQCRWYSSRCLDKQVLFTITTCSKQSEVAISTKEQHRFWICTGWLLYGIIGMYHRVSSMTVEISLLESRMDSWTLS